MYVHLYISLSYALVKLWSNVIPSDWELFSLDVENLQHQENQLNNDLLASIEPAPYYLDGASGGTHPLKEDLVAWHLGIMYILALNLTDQCQFIEGPLTDLPREHRNGEADDFIEVIRYHSKGFRHQHLSQWTAESPARSASAACCLHRFEAMCTSLRRQGETYLYQWVCPHQ